MSAIEPPPFLAELRQEFTRVAETDAAAMPATSARRLRLPSLRMPRLQIAVPVAAAVVALGGGALVATDVVSLPGDAPAPQQRQAADQGPTGDYSPELLRTVSLLSRPRTDADAIASDGLDTLVARGLKTGSSLQIDPPALAAGTVGASQLRLSTWVVPDRVGDVAVVISLPKLEGPKLALAASAAWVAENRAIATAGDDLVGLAPDGVRSVLVTMDNGARVRLPVEQNFFGAHLSAPFRSVEWGGMESP